MASSSLPGDRSIPEFSTGDPEDDELLRQIARRSPLGLPRHWVHFLICEHETGAREAAEKARAAGWTVHTDFDDDGAGWCIAAEQPRVIVCAETVQRTRIFFEGIAASIPGTLYDGWEASI